MKRKDHVIKCRCGEDIKVDISEPVGTMVDCPKCRATFQKSPGKLLLLGMQEENIAAVIITSD